MTEGRCGQCLKRHGVLRYGPEIWARFRRACVCVCDDCLKKDQENLMSEHTVTDET
jgi:hypothetical protein